MDQGMSPRFTRAPCPITPSSTTGTASSPNTALAGSTWEGSPSDGTACAGASQSSQSSCSMERFELGHKEQVHSVSRGFVPMVGAGKIIQLPSTLPARPGRGSQQGLAPKRQGPGATGRSHVFTLTSQGKPGPFGGSGCSHRTEQQMPKRRRRQKRRNETTHPKTQEWRGQGLVGGTPQPPAVSAEAQDSLHCRSAAGR